MLLINRTWDNGNSEKDQSNHWTYDESDDYALEIGDKNEPYDESDDYALEKDDKDHKFYDESDDYALEKDDEDHKPYDESDDYALEEDDEDNKPCVKLATDDSKEDAKSIETEPNIEDQKVVDKVLLFEKKVETTETEQGYLISL